MSLDAFGDSFNDSLGRLGETAKTSPPQPLEPSLSDAFRTAFDANRRYSTIAASEQNQHDFLQARVDAFAAKTGQKIANPWGVNDASRATRIEAARKQFDEYRSQLPDPDSAADPAFTFPSDEDIWRGGIDLARKARQKASAMEAGPMPFGAHVGALAGEGVVGLGDPLNAVAMATGAGAGSLAVRALKLGAGFMAQTAVSEAATYSQQKEINPEHSVGEAVGDVLMSGPMGAGMEVGGHLAGRFLFGPAWRAAGGPGATEALASAWRRVRGTPAVDHLPLEIRDAGKVVERAADLDAQNPFKGAEGHAAHAEAVAQVERDLLSDVPPAQPAAAAQEAAVRTNRVFTGNKAVDVRYDLAEAADLVASHDRNFRVNPDYPADMQPRDRANVASRDQVIEMANRLEPERLGPSPEANSGAPIVGPDNVVESGNGRTMAVREAYAAGSDRAAAYRAWLEREGFDTAGMNEPVLVARRTTAMTPEERADFAHAANGSAALRMNAAEQAMSDARHIASDVVDLLKPGKIDSAANRDFVRAFAGRLPQGERGGMLTGRGDLSASGVKRLQAALVARAYGDPDVVARAFDHAEPNIKTIAAALTDAAPQWVSLKDAVARGEIAAGHDITADIMSAVKTIMRARDEGENVGKMLAQGDFFQSDTSSLAARLFFKDGSFKRFLSKADMGENLQSFARGVLDQRGKGTDMFGAPPPDTGQVLGNVVRLSEARQAQVEAALKPEAIEKAFADPKVADAAEADLRRSIDQGRNRVAIENADGSVTMSVADAELHRMDQDIAAANEIRSCSAPGGLEEAG